MVKNIMTHYNRITSVSSCTLTPKTRNRIEYNYLYMEMSYAWYVTTNIQFSHNVQRACNLALFSNSWFLFTMFRKSGISVGGLTLTQLSHFSLSFLLRTSPSFSAPLLPRPWSWNKTMNPLCPGSVSEARKTWFWMLCTRNKTDHVSVGA